MTMTNDNKTPKGDVLDLPMGLTRAKIDANNDELVIAISVATNSTTNQLLLTMLVSMESSPSEDRRQQ